VEDENMALATTEAATRILSDLRAGDGSSANKLVPLVYNELRALAASKLSQERAGHTLQPTALAHEAYLKLIDQTRVEWQGRAHFLAVAAEVIRRILVDHARAHQAAKRGGGRRLSLNTAGVEAAAALPAAGIDLLDLDVALAELATLDHRQARGVELRFFGGLDVRETAEVLGVSERTVKGDWRIARAWLRDRLSS
jgi:RNA polymerase sigma-70 factor (ECF subfamily)